MGKSSRRRPASSTTSAIVITVRPRRRTPGRRMEAAAKVRESTSRLPARTGPFRAGKPLKDPLRVQDGRSRRSATPAVAHPPSTPTAVRDQGRHARAQHQLG